MSRGGVEWGGGGMGGWELTSSRGGCDYSVGNHIPLDELFKTGHVTE